MHTQPLAYFITFRGYGTWLQGDARGWARDGDSVATPLREGNRGLAGSNRARIVSEPFVMGTAQRECVDGAIRRTCEVRNWELLAANVRTNHVHTVVVSEERPEQVLHALKAWSTRALREAGLVEPAAALWSRHGSTRYLWNEDDVRGACVYVVEGQD